MGKASEVARPCGHRICVGANCRRGIWADLNALLKGETTMTRLLQTIVLAAALATAASAAEYDFTEWMTSSQLTQKLNRMNENRMFPGTVEGRVVGQEITYRAKFIPFLLGMNYFRSRWGMSDDWYKAYTEQFTRQGFKEYSH